MPSSRQDLHDAMSTHAATHTPDTVENAAATPQLELPFRELGLKENEFAEIVALLGRRPTAAELAMYSVMWSEHCSYKSSKKHLRQFGDKTTEAMREHLLVGIGENAGVVDIGDGWAVTFKVESHNHPSFVEPYQGAATGVGGRELFPAFRVSSGHDDSEWGWSVEGAQRGCWITGVTIR